MSKSILIIGTGSGLSQGVAEKFAAQGFTVSLISRNAQNLENIKQQLNAKGIEVTYAAADAGNAQQLSTAITNLSEFNSGFDVVLYNAAVLKAKDIFEETSASLTEEFTINVANALHSLQMAYPGLKQKQGAFLLTGGGLSVNPSADYGSLSIGKAGLRSLAYQLHERLKQDNIYVGLLTVAGFIKPESPTHSPAVLADLFWNLYNERTAVEFQQ
ncbi:SDR family NAD(P)-dependent oxidoreductase [Flavobacterium zepuense]|uniref:SDR family NAD(P)-dependent oxidoreductase n=1 Tax=Flavobacterium zepuense TaxID=2593302 RepID=A0A552VAQ4_9FLAO|nr:SDR family NAD(P)-dependent oxidoreductase [Flavobacterium zepuense]TRW27561.1 SDR family NAD(P)-dependent oxidoreductase [Flavobacterium zepuense]